MLSSWHPGRDSQSAADRPMGSQRAATRAGHGNFTNWSAVLGSAFAQFVERAGQFLPSILGAFLLLLIGWVVARVLRSVAVRAAVVVDRMLARFTTSGSARARQAAAVVGAGAGQHRVLAGAAVLHHGRHAGAGAQRVHGLAGRCRQLCADAVLRRADRRRRVPAQPAGARPGDGDLERVPVRVSANCSGARCRPSSW